MVLGSRASLLLLCLASHCGGLSCRGACGALLGMGAGLWHTGSAAPESVDSSGLRVRYVPCTGSQLLTLYLVLFLFSLYRQRNHDACSLWYQSIMLDGRSLTQNNIDCLHVCKIMGKNTDLQGQKVIGGGCLRAYGEINPSVEA